MMMMSLHPRILAFAELQQPIHLHHICWWWRGSEKNPCEACHHPLSTPYHLFWDACCSIPPVIKTQQMMMMMRSLHPRILLALVIPLSVCETQHQQNIIIYADDDAEEEAKISMPSQPTLRSRLTVLSCLLLSSPACENPRDDHHHVSAPNPPRSC